MVRRQVQWRMLSRKIYSFPWRFRLIIFVLFIHCQGSLAWRHELSVGYGGGQEIDENYSNTLFVANAKIYKFPDIDQTLIATIDASVSWLHADTPEHNSLWSASLAPALRGYFINPHYHMIKPYLEISSGPAYISKHKLGDQTQGGLYVLQSTLGGGIEFVKIHGLDLNLHFAHYCNAGLYTPNQGFDFPFIVSLGYLW